MRSFALLAIALFAATALAGCASDPASPTPATGESPTTRTPATASPTPGKPGALDGRNASESFDAAAGALPAGWTVVAGDWAIVEEASAPSGGRALKQSNTSLNETWVLADGWGNYTDLEANVTFRVLAGESGQAGGILFRYVDAKNYYVARYNHLENSWNLFRTIDGKREKFQPVDTAFTANLTDWIPMRVVADGGHIQVFAGETRVIDYVEESTQAPASGRVGLWGRYDSVVLFDDFTVETL